jgi:hypothetical protein
MRCTPKLDRWTRATYKRQRGHGPQEEAAMDKQNRITISITVEADLMADAHNAVDAMDLLLRERGGKVVKARFVRAKDEAKT